MPISRVVLLISALTIAMPAVSQSELQRCRAITDGAARLSCYDKLADAPRAQAPAAAAQPVGATAAAQGVAAVPRATGDAVFGLPESRRPDAVESVDSTLLATFSGWGPNSRIRLANGQVWQVIDGSSVVLPEGSRKVSVKRGLLSSFYLDIDGLKTSPRVRRVE